MLIVTLLTKSLTEYDRQRLCLTLLGLNLIQIFISVSGFSLGAYISLSANSKAHLIKGFSLKPIGGSLSGCSIALFVFHCLGAKASNDCGYPWTRHRFENKLLLIVLGYIVLSSSFLAIAIFCLIQNFRLEKALSYGLLHAMRFYAKDKSKKREFDEIQMDYRCCGSSNHTDWFRVKWMPETALPPENDKLFSRWEYLHSVPFSCCDPSSSSPCFHRLVKTERGEYRHPHPGFFQRGCTEVLLKELKEITQGTALLVLVPFFMELTIAVQTRYLQTSLEDSKRRGNANGIGSCWLFKRYPYDSDLQLKEEIKENLSDSSSSSEELVLFETRRMKHKKRAEDNLKESKIKPKEAQEKRHAVDKSDEDLQALLLKQVDMTNKNRRFKRASSLKYPLKSKVKENVAKCEKTKQTNNKYDSGGNEALKGMRKSFETKK